MNLFQIEWVGGWLDPSVSGPWPSATATKTVYVLFLGPLYVSIFPAAFTEGLWI